MPISLQFSIVAHLVRHAAVHRLLTPTRHGRQRVFVHNAKNLAMSNSHRTFADASNAGETSVRNSTFGCARATSRHLSGRGSQSHKPVVGGTRVRVRVARAVEEVFDFHRAQSFGRGCYTSHGAHHVMQVSLGTSHVVQDLRDIRGHNAASTSETASETRSREAKDGVKAGPQTVAVTTAVRA